MDRLLAEIRTLVLGDQNFEKDALIFTEVTSRSLTYGTNQGGQLKIDFPDTPHLGIWSKPGAPFVCIEPWQGHSDPAAFAGEIWDKPNRWYPGGSRSETRVRAWPSTISAYCGRV